MQKDRSLEGAFLQPVGFIINSCLGEGFDGFFDKALRLARCETQERRNSVCGSS